MRATATGAPTPALVAWGGGLLALAAVLAVVLLPPLSLQQPPGGFVDDRTLLGIPNCLDVVSNLPFLLIGAWGVGLLSRADSVRGVGAFADPGERWPYIACFAGVALVAFGSGYFHLAPDGARLLWDRLPMTVGFMSLVSATIAERISAKAGLRLLAPLVLLGIGSAAYWRWSVLRGTEDLLPYALVQYGSMALIVLLCAVFRSRYTRGHDIFVVVGIYVAAKVFEVLDAPIYALGGIVSGHTLKHLAAAVAVWWLLRMLLLRERIEPAAAVANETRLV